MPSLLGLPTEMLQKIIDQVSPNDLGNCSICCKKLNGVAEQRLRKHRERIETYSELRYSGGPEDEDDNHPARLLRDICLGEHIAFYPKILNIECCEYPDDPDDPDFEGPLSEKDLIAKHRDGELCQKICDEFESAINEKLSKTLCSSDRDNCIWRHWLKRGSKGAVLCLLLLLLPNLEQIRLTQLSTHDKIFGSMLRWIAEKIQDPDVIFGPVLLSRLSKVSVKGLEREGGLCQILTPFAAIPSL